MDKEIVKPVDINIDDQVIAESVSSEVLSHNDVSRFAVSLTDGITKNFLGRDSQYSGIKIQNSDNKISITIHIIVFYGVNIPQLSYELQMTIKNRIEKLTGLTVTEINISVDGIDRKQ